MAWIRIDDNAPHHPKQLSAGPAACWLWVCGLAYCQRMQTDGLIPIAAMPLLGIGNWKKLAGFLVTSGLWHKEDAGYRVHDYLDYQQSADEIDAHRVKRHEARVAAGRLGGQRSAERRREAAKQTAKQNEANASSKPEAMLEANAKQMLEAKSKQNQAPTPPHTRSPHDDAARRLPARPLIKPRNLNAAYEHPRFDVPQHWHNRTVDGLRDGEFGMEEFYRWLAAEVERTDEDTVPRFEWLDQRFKDWLSTRRGPVASDVPNVEETKRRLYGTRV